MRAAIWIAAAAMTAMLAACGPQGKVTVGKTHGGARTYFSEWRDIGPSELRINIAELPKAIMNVTEQSIRDNRILHQRVYFDSVGYFLMQHMLGANALFMLRVTKDANDFAKFAEEFKSWIGARTNEAAANKKRIYVRGVRGGWLTTVKTESIYRDCILARVGFLSKPEKNYTADEHYDTVVWFRDCSGKRSVEEVESFLSRLEIVSST